MSDLITIPNFKTALEDQVQTILMDYVGQNGVYTGGATNYIVSWERRMTDFDVETDLPMVIIIAKQKTQVPRPSGEMGTSRELWAWQCNIYYFDVEQDVFENGYQRQADLINRMQNALENETRLRGLSVPINPTSPTGAYNEYVYNNDWQTVKYDHGGQGEYWAFTGEMGLLVQTARN